MQQFPQREHLYVQTLGANLLRGLVLSLAVGCCKQQPHLPELPMRDFVVVLFLSLSLSLSLSRSALLRLLSYAQVLLALGPAEAGGIRNTAPPNKEIGWDGCAT